MSEEKRMGRIEFPCLFPIKVVGCRREDFVTEIHEKVLLLAPDFDQSLSSRKTSSGGQYESVTIRVNATSQEHLDSIYRMLNQIEGVRFLL